MSSTAEADRGRPLRVVVADDSEDMRLLLQVSLGRSEALEVVGLAADGEEAVRMTAEQHPDLVLLDFAMPGMDGLEAAARIREASPECRLVVLSGYRAELVEEDAARAGVDVFLEKAGGDANLFATIEQLFPGTRVMPPSPDRAPTARPVSRLPRAARALPGGGTRDELEQVLVDELQRARRAAAAKAALMRALAHDVRNPLTIIRGFALTLEQGVVDDEEQQRALLARIAAQADKVLEITADLLDADRLGDEDLPRVPTDLAQLAAQVLARVDDRAEAVELIVSEGVSATVEPVRVRYLLQVLVEHALDAGPAGAPVTVRLLQEPAGTTIRVEDAGPGIPEPDRGHLFEPSDRGAGPRAGLALVAAFATEHGGRAWVEDGEGGGAARCVFLPAG